MTEVDFVLEAMNAQKSMQLLADDHYVFDYPNRRQKRELRRNDGADSNDKNFSNDFIRDKYLKGKVYVPSLFPAYCSSRILTAEWCDGVKMNDLSGIEAMGFNISDV